MQSKPTGWDSVFSGNHKTEYKVVCGGVTYREADFRDTPVITKPMLDTLAIGRVCTGSLDLKIDPGVHTIPKAAQVQVYCRLVGKGGFAQETDWLPQGVYYIHKREGQKVLTLSCLDGMIKAGTTYRDKSAWASEPQWPQSMRSVVADIASIMSVSLDSRTLALIPQGTDYVVSYPNDDELMSEVLAKIGAACGGNWIMSESGELRLVVLPSATDTAAQTIGKTHGSYKKTGRPRTVRRVCLIDSAQNEFVAGDTDMDTQDPSDYPVRTASGNPITISDGAGGQPILDLRITIAHVQVGTGDPSPTNIRQIYGSFGLDIGNNGTRVVGIRISNEYDVYDAVYELDQSAQTAILTKYTECLSFDGTENWGIVGAGRQTCYFRLNIGAAGSVVSDSGICSHFKAASITSSTTVTGVRVTNSSSTSIGAIVAIRPDNAESMSTSDFKAWLAEQAQNNTPVQVLYTPTEPTVNQLTVPQTVISTVSGVNEITCQALTGTVTNMEMTYRAQTEAYGMEIVASCDYATQAIANALCNNTNGTLYKKQFQPYRVETAYIDPAIELGDVISCTDRNGATHPCVVMTERVLCSVAYTADISAGTDESEEEYPYLTMRELEAQRAVRTDQTYFGNRINRTEGFVSELMVGGEVKGRTIINGSTFKMQALRNAEGGGQYMKDCVHFETDPITGEGQYVFEEDVEVKGALTVGNLTDGQTVISGDNILTGTIGGDRLGLTLTASNMDNLPVYQQNPALSQVAFSSYQFAASYTAANERYFYATNAGIDNSAALMRVVYNAVQTDTVAILKAQTAGTPGSDILEISKLDTNLSTAYNVIDDDSMLTCSTKDAGYEEPVIAKITLPGDNQSHYVTIKYLKNGSISTQNDYAHVTPQFEDTSGEVSSTIQLKQGSIELTSAEVKFKGLVTFEALSGEGTTTINGDNITTGTVKANHIELAGNMEVKQQTGGATGGYIGYAVSNTQASSYGMALTAPEAYRDVWRTTEEATPLNYDYGPIREYGKTGQVIVTTAGAKLAFGDATTGHYTEMALTGTSAAIRLTSDVGIAVGKYSDAGSGTLRPLLTIMDLGSTGFYWNNLYAYTGPWTTSDRNQKEAIVYDVSGMDGFFDSLRPCKFRFKNGTSGRTHYGMIAQDVEDNLTAHGMTGTDFAGYGKGVDEETGEEHYSLRYEEFIALCIDQIQRLKARVLSLEGSSASNESNPKGSEA